MKKEPSVSVIMSVYNAQPYLVDAVESILNQSFKNLEFLIIDDASSDGSYKYLKKIRDKRVQVYKNTKNIGLASSLNKILKKSKGQFIARMDADDISMQKRLELQYEFLVKYPSIAICGTWAQLIDGKNKKKGSVHYPPKDKQIKALLSRVPSVIHPTWMIRREVYIDLHGYAKAWDFVEDYEFLLRARGYKMANLKKELLKWRSLTSRRSNEHISTMYRKSFLLKCRYFLEEKNKFTVFPNLLRAFVSTFFLPTGLKIYFNKKRGLI